jgi:hypothetical protein
MFSAPLVAREWGEGVVQAAKCVPVCQVLVRFLLGDAVYGETTDRLCWLPEPTPLLKSKKKFMCTRVYKHFAKILQGGLRSKNRSILK